MSADRVTLTVLAVAGLGLAGWWATHYQWVFVEQRVPARYTGLEIFGADEALRRWEA